MKLNDLFTKKKSVHDKNNPDIIDAEYFVKEDQIPKKKIRIPKITNPITELKRKREEERLRKEEEQRRKREQEKRERIRETFLIVGLLIACFIGLGVMNLNGKKTAEPVAVDEPAQTATVTPTTQPTSAPTPPSTSVTTPSSSSSAISPERETSTEPSESTSAPIQTIEPNPYHKLDNMSVSIRTDYAHFAEGVVIQGNGETFHVVIDTKNKDATVDDIIMYYDDSEIQILSIDYYSEGLDYPRVEYNCQTLKEGDFEIEIGSSYDDFNYEQTGNEFNTYQTSIKRLNWHDGQIVYLSYYGEKYHKSSAHAGDSWYAVTLWDAESMGIEPCGTCY